MVCSSCGQRVDSTTTPCSCGARWVGPPSTEPIQPVPRLIYGITAVVIIGGAIGIQLVVTIRSLYLSEYRWQWELLLTTSYLARFILPAALLAAYLAWRGVRLAARQPEQYGGLKLGRACLVTSFLVCTLNGGAVAIRVPQAIENWRLKQHAQTRVTMYKVHKLISAYWDQYGSYPERLIDLQEMDPSIRPILDAWDHPLVYTPMSAEIAGRGLVVPFQNYQLISRGRDGLLGTADDIVMRDGLITTAPPPAEDDSPERPEASTASPTSNPSQD